MKIKTRLWLPAIQLVLLVPLTVLARKQGPSSLYDSPIQQAPAESIMKALHAPVYEVLVYVAMLWHRMNGAIGEWYFWISVPVFYGGVAFLWCTVGGEIDRFRSGNLPNNRLRIFSDFVYFLVGPVAQVECCVPGSTTSVPVLAGGRTFPDHN